MLVYRIAGTGHVRDLTGAGARLYSGRWNHRGTALIYTSETRSLATVEYLVHVSLPYAPTGLNIATIGIPDDIGPEAIELSSLPRNWQDFPAPLELADVGTSWVQAKRSLLLRVPSAVVQHEHNLLINPSHTDMSRVVLVDVERLALDERLLRK